MDHYKPTHPSSWLVDKPRTTVAWNKFASSCFCLPGFRQLAHRAGRSMTGLRDDGIYDEEISSLGRRRRLSSSFGSATRRLLYLSNANYPSYTSSFDDESVVSDMTESETSTYDSLSEDEKKEDEKRSRPKHPAAGRWKVPPLPPPPPPLAPAGWRRHFSNSSTQNQSIQSSSHGTTTTTPPHNPARSAVEAASGKPPVSPHRPPQQPPLWTTSSGGNSDHHSANCRSFVTTGSSFSTTSSSSSNNNNNNRHQQLHNNNPRIRSYTGDSSGTTRGGSSVGSRHRRASPRRFDEGCLEGIMSEPNHHHHLSVPPPLPPPGRPMVVERSRLGSEVSALDENDDDFFGGAEDNGDSTNDSEGHSPFPQLELKGGNNQLERASKKNPLVDETDRRGSNRGFPPTTPPLRRKFGRAREKNSKRGGGIGAPKTTRKRTLRRKQHLWQSDERQRHKRHSLVSSSEPTNFLCKCPILEENFAALRTSTKGATESRVLVSGWIAVWFGERAADAAAPLSRHGRLRHPNLNSSSPEGISAENDLYYLRIVEDSAKTSLVLHRSIDGIQDYFFPIEPDWIVESSELEDRHLGRSVSIHCPDGKNNSLPFRIRLIPVALDESWKAVLDQRIAESAHNDSREATSIDTSPPPTTAEKTLVILPPHGSFAPDAQLDTARHLFFTLDSLAKQQHR